VSGCHRLRRGSAKGGKTNGYMFYVYILKSKKLDRYYTGYSEDYEKRLIEHNRGKVKSTKAYVPWKVIYVENFEKKSDALKRESEIKKYKSGNAFKKLIEDKPENI
jgi:putative endonuclease